MVAEGETGSWLNHQDMFSGWSPWDTVHWIVADSPAWNGSSPNENGIIFGGTARPVC